MFSYRVTNRRTKPLIRKIFERQIPSRRQPKDVTWQHRLVIEMTTDWGKALLGSPIGGGVAWFLINHKDALGDKRIRSVTVFYDRDLLKEEDIHWHFPTLLWEFEDVPSNDMQGSKAHVTADGKVQKPAKKGSGGAGGSRQSARLKGQQARI